MISTCIFDLETSDLDADKAIILCGVFQGSDNPKPVVYRTDEMNPGWYKGRRGDDSAITQAIIKKLSNYDVLVAHNGVGFDIPVIRTRALRWHLPRVSAIKIVDPLQILWRHFKLKSNSLGSVSDFIGSKDRKHRLDMSIWMDAILNGTKSSMDEIVKHCLSDVKELADVLNVVKPYIKILDDRGSAL